MVVHELARIWKDDPETRAWLMERARSAEHSALRLLAVHELARGWENDPETLPWLKDSARLDDWAIRLGLCRSWRAVGTTIRKTSPF